MYLAPLLPISSYLLLQSSFGKTTTLGVCSHNYIQGGWLRSYIVNHQFEAFFPRLKLHQWNLVAGVKRQKLHSAQFNTIYDANYHSTVMASSLPPEIMLNASDEKKY